MADSVALRIVVVDDEPLARSVVREYAAADPTIEIVADCANGFEAVKAVSEQKPDLVLLDVQMPKLDGFEVLELLGRDQAVVFITAYDQYALRAFEVHAVDYLLKPFSAERFQEAIARARERLRGRAAMPVEELVRDARAKGGPAERVLIRDGANVHVLEPLGYRTSLTLQLHAAAVITDSGGIQRESAWLSVPCIVLRATTEWVEAVESSAGRMVVVGLDAERAVAELQRLAPPADSAAIAARRAETLDLQPAGAAAAIADALAGSGS